MKYFKDWTTFEKIWVIIFTITTIALFFITHDTWIGFVAAITGMLCVILTAKGKISNYYIGIPNILAYSYIAWQNHLFGEMQLNMFYYLPMSILGIILWKRHINKKKTKDDVIVRLISNKERILWSIIIIIATFAYGYYLNTINAAMPYINSFTVVLSIIGMALTVKRAVEEWVVWIVVDAVTIVMWISVYLKTGNDISILVMWLAFLTNAVYGLVNWIRLHKEVKLWQPQAS